MSSQIMATINIFLPPFGSNILKAPFLQFVKRLLSSGKKLYFLFLYQPVYSWKRLLTSSKDHPDILETSYDVFQEVIIFVSAFWTWIFFHDFLWVFFLKCYILERDSKYLVRVCFGNIWLNAFYH